MPPYGFMASSPQGHPYMWGVQCGDTATFGHAILSYSLVLVAEKSVPQRERVFPFSIMMYLVRLQWSRPGRKTRKNAIKGSIFLIFEKYFVFSVGISSLGIAMINFAAGK